MIYTFKDGSTVDLLNVYEVTEIKDYGDDTSTIDKSTLSFTIRFKSGKSKKISLNYHYNDWFEVYKELRNVRSDLMKAIKDI